MGVSISENQHPNKNLTHFTVTLISENDDIHTLTTTVTSHPGVARDWILSALHQHRSHRHRLVIGLGVQWSPYEHSHYHHPAATIQLCIGRCCLIFHLQHADSCPTALRRLLSDPSVTFVGLWSNLDAARLSETHHQLEMVKGMPLDLRYHVEDEDGGSLKQSSIADIAYEVLGIDVCRSEEVGRSDWEVKELSLGQVEQAAVDAFVAYAIGMEIRAWELNPYC